MAIAAALVHRGKTGRGQWIDVGMYQLGPAVIPEGLIAAQAGSASDARVGNAEAGALLSDVYACAGRDRWLAVSVVDDGDWERIAAIVPGWPDVEPARRRDGEIQRQARSALAAWTRDRDDAELAAQLQDNGIAASGVATVRDVLTDDQYQARGFFEFVEFRPGDHRPLIGRPYRWTGAGRAQVLRRGPMFGEHNEELLARLGLGPTERDRLTESKVVVDHPLGPHALRSADLEVLTDAGVYQEIDPDYRRVIAQLYDRSATDIDSSANGTRRRHPDD